MQRPLEAVGRPLRGLVVVAPVANALLQQAAAHQRVHGAALEGRELIGPQERAPAGEDAEVVEHGGRAAWMWPPEASERGGGSAGFRLARVPSRGGEGWEGHRSRPGEQRGGMSCLPIDRASNIRGVHTVAPTVQEPSHPTATFGMIPGAGRGSSSKHEVKKC